MAKAQPTAKNDSFFARELKGETPLSRGTALSLVAAARAFQALAPWSELSETDLVVLEAEGREPNFFSVMGANGEFHALAVYVGHDGFRWFENAQENRFGSRAEMMASWNTLQAEFLESGFLEAPDRQLLKGVEEKPQRRGLKPAFRSQRAGYFPWFINEEEGKILLASLEAMAWFIERLRGDEWPKVWESANAFPFLRMTGEGEYSVRLGRIEDPPEPMPPIARWPAEDILGLVSRCKGKINSIQLGLLYMDSSIGKPSERKIVMRAGIALDSNTGAILHLKVATPDEQSSILLSEVLLQSIENTKVLPAQIHVSSKSGKASIVDLAKMLGAEVKVKTVLPALKEAEQGLVAYLRR